MSSISCSLKAATGRSSSESTALDVPYGSSSSAILTSTLLEAINPGSTSVDGGTGGQPSLSGLSPAYKSTNMDRIETNERNEERITKVNVLLRQLLG
jgi:hypothetical protein